MKFIVAAPELLEHLSKVSGAIVSKPVLPILDNFLFDIKSGTLTISTTDLETSMSTSLKVESKDDIIVAIPSRLLIDTVKMLNDQPITFTVNEETFGIELGTANGRYKLAGQSGTDFPKVPEIESESAFSMPSNVLLRCISKTLFATGNDDLRLNLTGVFVELYNDSINFVATDANRLVKLTRHDIKPGMEHTFILPKKALNLLKSSLSNDVTPIQIDFNKSNVFFTSNNLKLSCRLIDEKYPDYKAVIPQDNNNIVGINRIDFLETVSAPLSDDIEVELYDGIDLVGPCKENGYIAGSLYYRNTTCVSIQHIKDTHYPKEGIIQREKDSQGREDYVFMMIADKDGIIYRRGQCLDDQPRIKEFLEHLKDIGFPPKYVYGGINFVIVEFKKDEINSRFL
jgi:DNA polymerase-3 subunit beta